MNPLGVPLGPLGVTRIDPLGSFPWGVAAPAGLSVMVGTGFVVAGVAPPSSSWFGSVIVQFDDLVCRRGLMFLLCRRSMVHARSRRLMART